eukprot:14689713-Alexandrium_andersonii.AAC.1
MLPSPGIGPERTPSGVARPLPAAKLGSGVVTLEPVGHHAPTRSASPALWGIHGRTLLSWSHRVCSSP